MKIHITQSSTDKNTTIQRCGYWSCGCHGYLSFPPLLVEFMLFFRPLLLFLLQTFLFLFLIKQDIIRFNPLKQDIVRFNPLKQDIIRFNALKQDIVRFLKIQCIPFLSQSFFMTLVSSLYQIRQILFFNKIPISQVHDFLPVLLFSLLIWFWKLRVM
jgi:hypothetical protein